MQTFSALSLPFTLELSQAPEFLVVVSLVNPKGEVNLNYWIFNVDIKIALQASPCFHLCVGVLPIQYIKFGPHVWAGMCEQVVKVCRCIVILYTLSELIHM